MSNGFFRRAILTNRPHLTVTPPMQAQYEGPAMANCHPSPLPEALCPLPFYKEVKECRLRAPGGYRKILFSWSSTSLPGKRGLPAFASSAEKNREKAVHEGPIILRCPCAFQPQPEELPLPSITRSSRPYFLPHLGKRVPLQNPNVSPAKMQPADHMSMDVEYSLAPKRTSGGRYHSVTTWRRPHPQGSPSHLESWKEVQEESQRAEQTAWCREATGGLPPFNLIYHFPGSPQQSSSGLGYQRLGPGQNRPTSTPHSEGR